MVKGHCKKCKYVLERKKLPDKCPYCEAKGTLIEEKTAEQFLEWA